MLVSFGLYSEFHAEATGAPYLWRPSSAPQNRRAVSSRKGQEGEWRSGFPGPVSLPWGPSTEDEASGSCGPSAASLLAFPLLPDARESSPFSSGDDAPAASEGPERGGARETRRRRREERASARRRRSAEPENPDAWCLRQNKELEDWIAHQLYDEDMALALAATENEADAWRGVSDDADPSRGGERLHVSRPTAAADPGAKLLSDRIAKEPPASSLVSGQTASTDSAGPRREACEAAREAGQLGRSGDCRGHPAAASTKDARQTANRSPSAAAECTDSPASSSGCTHGERAAALGVNGANLSPAFQVAEAKSAPSRQSAETFGGGAETAGPPLRETAQTEDEHEPGDACPFWCVWTRECYTTQPVFHREGARSASLLEEAEAFVARAANGATMLAAGKASLRLHQAPRHLALYVSQVSSRMFFDPQYRTALMSKYVS
ncbi:conserved hypothetical protein [Neospora caninum Liverpool]|uniref:Uncharacterized protein n=1 Tax=Neospora caninum (strain Liverpool) TaxID=572307 RepID=F0VB74_NEOCL|nr:conserved hypothetical protein [Neospora caninum Liverpool]CBZ51411.1 conserved hypothetical protein [Neospora caninum Liverpool]CEL68731.1 TPA: hypothetical protein BN1204_044720 [Neospora caninum Liverpool]|eukprot:XP_003881444.1 conserved hypothetical protein [Neospora caninum Liverpool]